MSERFDIVIVGAGMIGLTLAGLLARSQHADRLAITVLDAGIRPDSPADADVDLRVSAVSLGSASLLRGLGAWDTISSVRASAFEGMRVWDARSEFDGPETLFFDAADFGVPELGFIVENVLIRVALLDALADANVDLRFATPIRSVDAAASERRFDVHLDNGEVLSPDLLIGADGAGSLVRKGASIPVRAWQYPQSALVTHVRPELPHQAIAWQRFLKNGPIALLPLADGRASVVWSTSPEKVTEALDADAAGLAEMLTTASDGVLGELVVEGPAGSFPLRAQHALRYIEPGLALVGDAAHSVHPLAGQGANLGFADADALARAIASAIQTGEYPGDLPTLRHYERARRGANATMLHFIDSINRLFLSDRGLLAGLRTSGMRLFNRSGPIRRRAVEVALGINI